MPRSKILSTVLCGLFLAAKCGTPEKGPPPPTSDSARAVVGKADTVYHLDFAHREAALTVDDAVVRGGPYKFVEIDVSRVVNPRKRSLTVDVSYRAGFDAAVHLGSFTLYPADNPGTFIVPTLNALRDEGSIILSLGSPDLWTKADSIEVVVRRVSLLSG